MKYVYIIFLLTTFYSKLLALDKQDFISGQIQRFEKSFDLSNNVIHSIAQDTTGFLWIGTSYGLNKYDGSKVTHYFFDPNNEQSIGDNYIQKIFLDKEGILWVLVPKYLCRYDEEHDTFIRYSYSSEKINTHRSDFGEIVDDGKGVLWIGTPEMGSFSFNKHTGKIAKFNLDTTNIFNIILDKEDDALWICGVGEISKYYIATGKSVNYKLPTVEPVLGIDFRYNHIITTNHIYNISFSKENEIIVSSAKSLLNIENKNLSSFINNENCLWIGTKRNGLFVYNKKTRGLTKMIYNRNDSRSISNNTILTLFEDRDGQIWIGTSDGINRYIRKEFAFKNYMIEDGLLSNNVLSVLIDNKGLLWVGGYEGISKQEEKNKIFFSYTSVVCEGTVYDISNIRDMAKDSKGNIWLGKKERVFVYTSDGKFKTFTLPYKNEGSLDLLSVYADGDTSLLVGTYGNGLYKVNMHNYLLQEHLDISNSQLSSNYVKDVIRLQDENICLATLRKGLDIYNPKTGKVKNIKFSQITQNYVSDFINCVFQDSRSDIWVMTWNGIFVLDKDYKLRKHYSSFDGIASDELTSVSEDINGDIWIGSTNGLSRICKGDIEHICNYSSEDGLISNNISTGSVIVSDGVNFAVGTVNGVSEFTLQDVPINYNSVSPIITGLKIFNKEVKPNVFVNGQIVLPKQIHLIDEITLNHRQKMLQIEFSVPGYGTNDIMYAYKLDGMDKDWIYISDNTNYASYSNLYFRDYTFRVKARNSSGIWSAEKIVKISMHPPFWQTWWAFTIYIVVFMLIIVAIFVFILSKERLKQEIRIKQITFKKENEINAMKLKFFTNVSHDLRTPLTLIITPLEHLLKNNSFSEEIAEQIAMVRKNAIYLLSLINQLLDFRKMEVDDRKLRIAKHDIVKFVRTVVESFDGYANQKNITLECVSDSQSIDIWYDEQLMQKVMFNLIGNALKFTADGGNVAILIEELSDSVEIKVSDTGIGIDPEHQQKIFEDYYQVHNCAGSVLNNYTSGSGIGLSIVKRYVEMHNSNIDVKSILGEGSVFSFRLKKGNMHFSDIQIDKNSIKLKTENDLIVNKLAILSESVPEKDEADLQDADTVLVVDDNPDILRMLSIILGDKFRIMTALNAKDGVDIARKELPDVIVSDVMMPQVDGLQLAKAIKENPLTAHIPILFLTAKSSLVDVVQGLGTGASDYITKPFNEDILIIKITNLINDRRLLLKRKALVNSSDFSSEAKEETQDPSCTAIYLQEDALVSKVIAFIEENMGDAELNSELIENYLKLSKMQLYRKLKAVAGLSVSDVIKKVRMTNACRLLKDSELNISEIAYQLGYSDPLYFSKTFKKEIGLSPVQFRQHHTSD